MVTKHNLNYCRLLLFSKWIKYFMRLPYINIKIKHNTKAPICTLAIYFEFFVLECEQVLLHHVILTISSNTVLVCWYISAGCQQNWIFLCWFEMKDHKENILSLNGRIFPLLRNMDIKNKKVLLEQLVCTYSIFLQQKRFEHFKDKWAKMNKANTSTAFIRILEEARVDFCKL